jgi:capsular polysaccharide biosynthesis protein
MKHRLVRIWMDRIRPIVWRVLAVFLRLLPISSRHGGVPKGVIWDATEWIRFTEAARPWAERGCRHWQIKVRNSEVYIGGMPRTIEKSVHPVFFDQRFFHFPELSVTCIRRGRIATAVGTILSPDDNVFDQFTHQWGDPIRMNAVFTQPGLPRMEYKEGAWATLVVPAAGHNVGHWWMDGLLRLAVFEEAGISADIRFILYGMDPRYLEPMEALGYGRDRCAGLNSGHWEVEHLLVPSFLAPPGYPRPWAYRWLRGRLGIDDNPPGERRFWIGRNRARWRRIVNEEEILPILEKAGFEYVVLEDLSFRQQMDLFSQAGAIAAPHGAGMTDLMFAPRGIPVLELFAERYIIAEYCMLAHVLDQKYFYLTGASSAEDRSHEFLNMDNFRIAPERLVETLELMSLA